MATIPEARAHSQMDPAHTSAATTWANTPAASNAGPTWYAIRNPQPKILPHSSKLIHDPSKFYVSSSYEAKAWVKDDESIDCATTSVCASGQITAKQACSSWNLAGTVETKFDIIKDIWSVSGSFNPGGGRSSCTTASSTNTCSWDDMKCHALWTSNVELINRGYIRRRCHDKGEDYTAWSKDWNVNSPESTTRLGCGASCTDTQYPGPVPSVPGAQGKKL